MCTFSDNPEFFLLLSFHSPATCRGIPHTGVARLSALDHRECLSRTRRHLRHLLLLVSAYAECFSWIFRDRRREKFPGLTTNRRICEDARHEVCAEKDKKKRKGRKLRRARRVLWRFFGIFVACAPSRYRPPSVWYSARTPARNSISGSALQTSTVGETVISVVLRSVEELWKSPRETPCLEHVSDEMIARLGFQAA